MENFKEILFILGYGQILPEKYKDSGFFLLPLSIENVSLNLARLANLPVQRAKKQLLEFLETNKSAVELREHSFTYFTGRDYYHHHVRNRCYSDYEDFKNAEISILLGEELAQEAKEAYSTYQPDCEIIYQELSKKIKTIKDLIFLTAMKRILEENYNGKSGVISSSLNLKQFNLDKEVLQKLEGFSADDEFSELNRYKYLGRYFAKYIPSDTKAHLLLNAHGFNSSSCGLLKCLYMHPRLCEFVYNELSELPLQETIKSAYSSKLSDFEQKYGTPLFESKNKEFQLLEKIYPRLRRKERAFTFEADEFESELAGLCNRDMLYIEDEEIKIKDEEKVGHYYFSLRDKEIKQIDSITKSFIKEWLPMKAREIITDTKQLRLKEVEETKKKGGEDFELVKPEVQTTQLTAVTQEGKELEVRVKTTEEVRDKKGTIFSGDMIFLGTDKPSQQCGVIGKMSGKKVLIDLNEPHTISIFGVQRSGKSYTLGVITEMAGKAVQNISTLAKPVASVIFHYSKKETYIPEFESFIRPNRNHEDIRGLKELYEAEPLAIQNIKIIVPPGKLAVRKKEYEGLEVEPLLFRPQELGAPEWRLLLGAGGEQLYLKKFKNIIEKLKKENRLTVEHVKTEILTSELNKDQKDLSILRVSFVEKFLDENAKPFEEYLLPGSVILLDIRDEMMDEQEASILLGMLLISMGRIDEDNLNP
jgi:hypothetical protein